MPVLTHPLVEPTQGGGKGDKSETLFACLGCTLSFEEKF